MSKMELQRSLESLKSEVADLGDEHIGTQKRFQHVIAELEEQIDDIEDEEVRESMVSGMSRLIEQFEEEHPSITEATNRVMTILSNMGI